MSELGVVWDLERCRDYLKILARLKIPHHLRDRLDPSDLAQETMLCAFRDGAQCRGESDAERVGWLRGILVCRLIDAMRRLKGPGAAASLDQELAQSSARLAEFLVADQSAPSARLKREELAIEVARRLARLTEAQAEAVHLRHWEGWSVNEIGRHMGRSPVAVGGLLRHGLEALREMMKESSLP